MLRKHPFRNLLNSLSGYAPVLSVFSLFVRASTHQPQPLIMTAKKSITIKRFTRSRAMVLSVQIFAKCVGAVDSKPLHLQVQEVRVPASVLAARFDVIEDA